MINFKEEIAKQISIATGIDEKQFQVQGGQC